MTVTGYAPDDPCQAVTPAQAAMLRPHYQLSVVKHVRSLTVFLLTRALLPVPGGNQSAGS